MSRGAVLVLVGLLSACGDAAPEPVHTSRFEGVVGAQGDIDQVLHDVCDVSNPAATAPEWQWPASEGEPERHAGKWTWVNVWATWCHPCLEEMPMLERTLASGPIGLSFLSADATADDLARFRREHSFDKPSPRLLEASAVASMVSRYGFRGASSLPVHVLVDPENKVRCVRAGLVEARHVEQVLTALGQASAPRIR